MKYIWHTDFINCVWRRHARLDCRAKVRRKAVICKPRSAIIDHCNFIFPITPSKSAYSHIARALREKNAGVALHLPARGVFPIAGLWRHIGRESPKMRDFAQKMGNKVLEHGHFRTSAGNLSHKNTKKARTICSRFAVCSLISWQSSVRSKGNG